MDKTIHAQANSRNNQNAIASPAFQFQKPDRSVPENTGFVPPFTEIPEELKDLKDPVIKNPRRFLNALFLLVLGLALLALIAAFAYQLINHPEMLANAGLSLVNAVEGFIQQITGGG